MRIDRSRLERSAFPQHYEIGTRFSDMDKVGHINNVAIADLLQEARNRFFHGIGLLRAAPGSMVVAAISIEFAADLFHPEPAEISVGVLEIGRSSFRIAEIIQQKGHTAVYAEVVQVARGSAGAAAFPEPWRPLLEQARIAVK